LIHVLSPENLTDYDWRSGNSLVGSNKGDKYGIETKEKRVYRAPSERSLGRRSESSGHRGTRRLTRKSDVAHTNSTLNAAENTAGTWTIGSRRNGNSKVGRFGLSRPIRESATLADKEENHVFRLDRYK
jgi:hypothetical protein